MTAGQGFHGFGFQLRARSLRRALAAVVLAAGALLVAAGALAQPAAPLQMALIPYLSPNVLIPLFQPLANHFSEAAGRPVHLYSAPDIRAHVLRILEPDFDIVFTAPHFGRLAQIEGGYIPIGSFEQPLTGVVTVREEGPVNTLDDLRGRRIAVHDRLVLNTILVLEALAAHGIDPDDFEIVFAASQNSALMSVAAGAVDAAITVNFAVGLVPDETRRKLRVILQTPETASIPGTLILVHPALPASLRSDLAAALQRFAHTETGQRFLVDSSYRGVVGVDADGLRSLDRYLPELRRLLNAGGAR